MDDVRNLHLILWSEFMDGKGENVKWNGTNIEELIKQSDEDVCNSIDNLKDTGEHISSILLTW